MKFSYNWIKEFIPSLDVEPEALERLITMKTAECDGIEVAGALLNGAVPARIETVEPIEGAHNVKATVDAGPYGRKTVACGASNCRAGITTVYVPLGVKKVSGILSDGMLASAAELEINKDHAGILELDGTQELPASDRVIEIDNKSITHRPDLWGHHGMAREVAAITGHALVDRVHMNLLPGQGSSIRVEIEDLTLCPRYSALIFENVKVQPSPLWLQARLTAVGLNPKNNLVDLTNFIMAELAQPMHAFDKAKLHGDTISARRARPGERITALNDEVYELTPNNLVIADASGPIALAGVIGGKESAISESTTTIVLESACFQASNIRKTSSSMKLRTDASMRFEKAQDPRNTTRALARAIELLPLISPGARLVGGLADLHREFVEPAPIVLTLAWLDRKLGRNLDIAEVRRILESLEFGVAQPDAENLSVTVPSWRATKDISMPDDLVEEVGRMIGYDSIPPAAPLVLCRPSFDPPEREFLRHVKRAVAAQGFTEVSNYSFISEDEARRFGFAVENHIRVLNPIAAGQELMRTSLLPGIHRNLTENAKHLDSFRLFEIGREIHKTEAKPDERTHLAAAIYSKDDGRAALLELKRTAEGLAPGLEVRPAMANSWEHTTRAADLCWMGTRIGRLSELHPGLIESGRGAVLDIDLQLLRELIPASSKYRPVRRFPTSAFDLSIIVPERELAGNIERRIRELSGELTETVNYFDEYHLSDGKKSVTFRITVGASDRTLSSAEIAGIRSQIINGLTSAGYELRV
jgi:phenylalanyl-tRNA synthetase beta chain